jgi:hypothetical protein
MGPTVCEWAFNRPKKVDEKERKLRSLAEYLAPHGYIHSLTAIEEYQGSAVIEWGPEKGKLMASTLRLADNPLARRVIANLVLYPLQ